MFNIYSIERSMKRDDWTLLYQIIRKVGDRGSINDESLIAERMSLQREIDSCTVNGKIGLGESGRDCDCVMYCHGRVVDAITAIQFQHRRADMTAWADGPCHLWVCRPDELPENESRDLVLEAFEDGHPHTVSTVRYETH